MRKSVCQPVDSSRFIVQVMLLYHEEQKIPTDARGDQHRVCKRGVARS